MKVIDGWRRFCSVAWVGATRDDLGIYFVDPPGLDPLELVDLLLERLDDEEA